MRKVWWIEGSRRRSVGMREGLLLAPEGVREGTEVIWVDEDWLKMYCAGVGMDKVD